MRKFRIVKKCIDGIQISGYLITDEENNERLLKEDDVVTLCRNNMVENAEAILDADTCEYVININNGLDSLDTMYANKRNMGLKLVYRIISTKEDGKSLVLGYIAQDKKGKTHKISSNKAWLLASNNNIDNVRALIIDNKKVLKSIDGLILSQIPEMTQE